MGVRYHDQRLSTMSLDIQKATQKPEISFILASSSPRRKELLGQLINGFKIVGSEVPELENHEDGPEELVLENAKIKSQQVAESFPDHWVLGADTLVALGGEVFSKPENLDHAKCMLLRLSGRTHQVHTGISFLNLSQKICRNKTVSTSVTFKKLSESIIDAYFKKVDPLDKAGAYAIQTCPEMIVESYEGSLSNVIGLPKEELQIWFGMYGLLDITQQ